MKSWITCVLYSADDFAVGSLKLVKVLRYIFLLNPRTCTVLEGDYPGDNHAFFDISIDSQVEC